MACNGPMTTTCNWTAGPVPAGRSSSWETTATTPTTRRCICASPSGSTDCIRDPYVPVDDVVGKVFVLLWPHSRFHVLHRPADFAGIPDTV